MVPMLLFSLCAFFQLMQESLKRALRDKKKWVIMLFVNRKNNKGNNQGVGYRRSLVMKTKVLTRVTMMVALMIVSGVLTIPLPGLPVPIVLQNMMMMLAGGLLGKK